MFRWPWKRKRRASSQAQSTATSTQDVEPPTPLPLPLPTISLPEESSTEGESLGPQKTVVQSQGRAGMRLNVPKHKHLRHQASTTSDYGSLTGQIHEEPSTESESLPRRPRASSNVSSSSFHSDVSSSTYYSAEGHSPTDSKRLPAKGSAVSPVFSSKERDRLEQLERQCRKYEEQLQECAELKKRVFDLEKQMSRMQERKGHEESSATRAAGEGGENGGVEETQRAVTTRLTEGIEVNSTQKKTHGLPLKQHQSGVIQRRKTDTQLMMLEQHDQQLRKKRERMLSFKKFTSCPEPSQLPSRPCKREVLLWLANKVSSWKFLGRWLGLEERDIQRIVTENSESVREQCYQMFVQWENLHPEMCNYCVLGEALVNDEENRSLYSQFVERVAHQ